VVTGLKHQKEKPSLDYFAGLDGMKAITDERKLELHRVVE